MAKNKTSKKRKGSIFVSGSKALASSLGAQTEQTVENTSKTEANILKFAKPTKHKAK